MPYSSIFEMVGRTPSIELTGAVSESGRLFLKLEGMNPSGSIKDRACALMIRNVLRNGRLTAGKTVLDASSGNFACALALYAKVLGFRAEVVVSSKLTAPKRDYLTYLGAEIRQHGQFTVEGNTLCRELVRTNPHQYCFLDQLHNPDNPRAHYEATAPELMTEFPDLSVVIGSLGSGGTMAGVARYFKHFAPHVKMVVVECLSGNRIPGTASFADGDYMTPFVRSALAKGDFDIRIGITEADAAKEAYALLDQGIVAGLQTGGLVHAARACRSHYGLHGTLVALSGDAGWKNLDKLLASLPSGRDVLPSAVPRVPRLDNET